MQARIATCLVRWRADAVRSRRIRLGLESLVEASDLRSYRAVVAEWRAQAWLLRRRRRGIERLFRAVAGHVLLDGFGTWARWTRDDAAEERREVLAASHWQGTSLGAAVAVWRAARLRAATFRSCSAAIRARVLLANTQRALSAWRARYGLALLRHGLTLEMRERWLAALSRGVMREWFAVAHRRRMIATVGSSLAHAVASGTQRRLFVAWAAAARSQLLNKAARAQWVLALQRRMFFAWQRYWRLRRLEARWIARLERSAVVLWRRTSRAAKAQRLASAVRLRTEAAVLHEWRRRLHATVGARVAQHAAVARLSSMAAAAAVRRWRHTAFVRRLVRERVGRFRHAWVAQTFAALRAYAVHSRSKRERLWAARSALATSCAARVMEAWSAVARAGKAYRAALALQQEMRLRMERKIDAARLATVAVAFARWCQCIRATVASRRLARRFQLHTRVRRLTLHWAIWAGRKHRAKAIGAHVARVARVGTLARAWGAVTASADEAARERRMDAVATRFSRGLELRRHASVVRFWRGCTARAVALQRASAALVARRLLRTLTAWRLLGAAIQRGRMSVLLSSFSAWRSSTADSRARRVAAARAVEASVAKRCSAHALGTWHRLATGRRQRRAALAATEAAVSVLIVGRAAQRGLRVWAAAARRAAGLRALARRRPKLVARRALRRWTLQSRLSVHRALQAGKAEWFHSRRLLSVSLAAWRGRCYSAAGPEKRLGAAARVLAAEVRPKIMLPSLLLPPPCKYITVLSGLTCLQEASSGGGGWESPDGGDGYSELQLARQRYQRLQPLALAPPAAAAFGAGDGGAHDSDALFISPSFSSVPGAVAQQQQQQQRYWHASIAAEATLDREPGGLRPGRAATAAAAAGFSRPAASAPAAVAPSAQMASSPMPRASRGGSGGLDDARIMRYRRSSLAGGVSSPPASRLLEQGGSEGGALAAPSSSARKRAPPQHLQTSRSLSPSLLAGGRGPPPSPGAGRPPRPDPESRGGGTIATPARPRVTLPRAIPLDVLPRFASRALSPLSASLGGPPLRPPSSAAVAAPVEHDIPPYGPLSPAAIHAAGQPLSASALAPEGPRLGSAKGLGAPPSSSFSPSRRRGAAQSPRQAAPPRRGLSAPAPPPAWLLQRPPARPSGSVGQMLAQPPVSSVDLGDAHQADTGLSRQPESLPPPAQQPPSQRLPRAPPPARARTDDALLPAPPPRSSTAAPPAVAAPPWPPRTMDTDVAPSASAPLPLPQPPPRRKLSTEGAAAPMQQMSAAPIQQMSLLPLPRPPPRRQPPGIEGGELGGEAKAGEGGGVLGTAAAVRRPRSLTSAESTPRQAPLQPSHRQATSLRCSGGAARMCHTQPPPAPPSTARAAGR